MKLSQFSIRRPIFTTMVTLIVIILGSVSLMRLPIDLMPDITFPTLSVRTDYENASPQEMEELITRPIEEAVSAVPGVEEVSSTSSEGSSSVRISFTWGTDLSEAADDVRERIDRVVGRLPEDADRPTLFKFDPASMPILILGASSRLDPVQMKQIIEDQIKYRLERVPGVAALDVWGGHDREIHVDVFPDVLESLALSLDEVLDGIRTANVSLPAGKIDRGNFEVTVRVPGEYTDLDQLRNTVVAVRNNNEIKLNQVASVEDSWTRVTRVVRINGKQGIHLAVRKQSGTNTVSVADRALAEIERIRRDIPQIELTVIMDGSDYIKRSISNVSTSALLGGGMAVIVLLVFLRSLRSTVVIATAIPVSIIAAFALLYFNGFTLNIMTLGGLALGVGMLVDSSIVVLENIYRLGEGGLPPDEAAAEGSQEVTSAIIASTLTTMAVFLPMLFVRGMSGVMFKQFALVVSFALLCSLVVAITLVPMLAARIMRGSGKHNPLKHGSEGAAGAIGGFFRSLENGYRNLLHTALRHRAIVIVSAVALLSGSLLLVMLVGVELMPAGDEGELNITAEMEVGTRLELLDARLKYAEQIVRREVPELKNLITTAGSSGWRSGGSHSGSLRISLVPQNERERSTDEIATELRKKLSGIPGLTIRTRPGRSIGRLLSRMMGGDDRIAVEVRGHDFDTADALAQRVKHEVEQVPGITDVRMSRDSGNPEENIIIDREKAADMKLTVSRIAQTLQTALAGTRASNYRESGDEYTILVQLKDAERLSLDDVLRLTVTNAEGEQIMLRNVVGTEARSGPVTIERKDQQRIISVWADYEGRDMGSVMADIRQRVSSVAVPHSFTIAYTGNYEEQQEAFQELLLSLVLALTLVYMVMACQFESLRDPFVVMFSVPLAAIGVILMLFLTDTTFNMQSFIGCIMLGGIVVNNAILLVDHTNLLRRRDGLPLRDAIEEAGRRRLRPILMTALTTMLGLTPLALGLGEGGETQAPMARAVIGGLFSSTLITLVFVPVVYSIFERKLGKHQPEKLETQ